MRRLACLAAVLLAASPVLGRPLAEPVRQPDGAAFAPGLSDSVRVSLLTMLPGQEVYSLWGHSALRIRDDAAGLDRTYNYGTFDFEQPFFVLRFLRGQLDYVLDSNPYEEDLYVYRVLQRPIIEQTLDLPPETARALYALLEENALPENRAYRYDFLRDNCSTRLLGILDAALEASGQPPISVQPDPAPKTFREYLAPALAGVPAIETGIDLGLGMPADVRPEPREQVFLPLLLMDRFDGATVGSRPLVARRDTVFWVEGAGVVHKKTAWLSPLLLVVFGALYALGLRRRRAARVADTALFGLAGLAGLILAALWFLTDHTVTGPNLNLLWLWPTHLGLAVAAARQRIGPRWRVYLWTYAAAAVLALVLFAAGVQGAPVGAWGLGALLMGRSAWLALKRPATAPP